MQTLHMIQPPNEDSLCLARLQKFTAMPHQPMLMLGAIQAVVVMLWWLADIAGRYGGWYTPFQWSIPAPWAHLYLMIFCLFPPYMFGFLMTTYPKWMAGAEISPKHFLPAAALLACGVLLAYVGLIAGKVWFMAAIIIYLIGWAFGLFSLLYVYVGAKRPDTLHAIITSGVLSIGFCLLLVYLFGIIMDNAFLVGIARSGGIWWFLFPVFFSVSHRMIPFFSGAVIQKYVVVRPNWTLAVLTLGGLIHGALEVANQGQWTWLVDFPMSAVAFWLSYKWSIRKVFEVRILAMLHVAFVWVGIALALFSVQSVAQLFGIGVVMGRSPLHALMIGYFASMLIAMSTRVTLGHSGRPLSADQRAWAIFITVQLAALVRVLADFPGVHTYASHLYLCSALLWLVAFGSWLFKFTPMYWTKP